jgi:hypothetical protein
VEVAYVCRAVAAEDCGGGGVGMMGSRVSRFAPVGVGGDLYLLTLVFNSVGGGTVVVILIRMLWQSR